MLTVSKCARKHYWYFH